MAANIGNPEYKNKISTVSVLNRMKKFKYVTSYQLLICGLIL